MGEDAHLNPSKDRKGKFSGYYKCSLCPAEFRPNPRDRREMMIAFAAHVGLAHPAAKTNCEDADKAAGGI
jgi:hypothetical protein